MFLLTPQFQKLKLQFREIKQKTKILRCLQTVNSVDATESNRRRSSLNGFMSTIFFTRMLSLGCNKVSLWRSGFIDIAKKSVMKTLRITSTSSITKRDFVISSQRVFLFLQRSEATIKQKPAKSFVSATQALRQTRTHTHTLCRVSPGRCR